MPKQRFSGLVPIRPEKPNHKYDPNFCDAVRDMAQKGMFPEEWCAHIGVTMSTLYNWANAHEDFEEAMHIAWHLLRAYWTKQARESKQGIGMPPSVLVMLLERRFPDTWGKTNPRNTHETFANRNKTDDEEALEDTSPEAMQALDEDQINERIAQLEARRAQEGK